MSSTEYLVGFIVAAVLTPVIILGGMTLVYFLDKHRPDRPEVDSRGRTSSTAGSADHQSTGDIVDTFAPLGSSLAAGARLRPDDGTPPAPTLRSSELSTSNPGGV